MWGRRQVQVAEQRLTLHRVEERIVVLETKENFFLNHENKNAFQYDVYPRTLTVFPGSLPPEGPLP